MAKQVQIQDEAVCITHSANTLGKGMRLTIPPSAMCKYSGSLIS